MSAIGLAWECARLQVLVNVRTGMYVSNRLGQ